MSSIDGVGAQSRPAAILGALAQTTRKEFRMITRIWHGATPATKSDEYLNLTRTVAIPDYRSTPGNKGAYALRRMQGNTAHFLMITFWESHDAIRTLAGDDIHVAKDYE